MTVPKHQVTPEGNWMWPLEHDGKLLGYFVAKKGRHPRENDILLARKALDDAQSVQAAKTALRRIGISLFMLKQEEG